MSKKKKGKKWLKTDANSSFLRFFILLDCQKEIRKYL